MRRSFLLSFLLVFVVVSSFATTKKVLFIGNSYTFTNNMPLMVQSIATAFGDTLIYDESDPGGYTLMQHTTYPTTIAKIASRPWDVVMIHEQSQMPAFPPSQVLTDVYPYATRLDSMVHANDTCTQTMFLMTWGHANGDPSNCAGYPAICTYGGMQKRLRESYMEMALNNHAAVAPVGMAFKLMIDSMYAPWLISSDSSHPVVAGSYLEACVVYASIFHKETRNCSYIAGLTTADAGTLQRVADKVVFDSLTLWQQNGHYPSAVFTHVTAGSAVTFTGHSAVPSGYSWSFGDMISDTTANPVHVYTASGTYVVSHTVTTPCFTETLTDTVHIGSPATGINSVRGNASASIISQGNGIVRYDLQLQGNDELQITDMKGSVVRRYNAGNLPAADRLQQGIYVYRLFTYNGKEMAAGQISVY